MNEEELDELRARPSNSKLGLIYYAKDDPRVVVPKSIKWMGWTINFAHPYAWPMFALFMAIAVVPIGTVLALGIAAPVVVIVTVVATVAVLTAVAAYAASRK